MDDTSKEKLRRNHELIVDTVDLTRSTVLDHLIQDGILSSNEEEEIRTVRTRREKNSLLLSFLKRRGDSQEPIEYFIKALRQDYGFVAEKLEGTYVQTDRRTSNVSCLRCSLLLNLEPRDISHFLYQEGAIQSEDDLSEVNSYLQSRPARVKRLFQVLAQSSKESEVQALLSRSLEKKYAYIVISNGITIHDLIHCQCQSSQNTTNGSKEKLRLKSPRKKSLPSSFNPTVQRYSYRTADKKGEDDFTDRIVPVVTPSSPTDIKLLRKCSTLWNHLFAMRERGDWANVDRLTMQARAKYANCPDIQVLLYRSQMCVSIFYKDDHDQAMEAFDKAMYHVPSSTMVAWHLARTLPLKVALLTSLKRFEEAERWISDAHQVMRSLKPCLSSGAVYFFEALYLSAILRCNRGGTQSEKIFERIKECFMMAIEHYQQEKIFAIKSFLNQVYIFLALFALGIDFRNVVYMESRNISTEAAALANHYLSLFENECWEEATKWSKMLFFIGRAEQHKLLQNYERSGNYLNDALEMAKQGSFVDQKKFIEKNIEFVSVKRDEKVRGRQAALASIAEILEEISADTDSDSS